MGVKSLLLLFVMSASATAFAAPPATKKRPATDKRPAPVAAPVDCKTQKTRLHHDEKVLRARQQLALEECRASARPGSSRCDDLKRQQKAQHKQFKEQRKVALGQCKAFEQGKVAKHEPRDRGKKAARSR